MKNVKVTGLEVVTPNLLGTLVINPATPAASWSTASTKDDENLPMTVSLVEDLTTTAANLGTGLLVVPGTQTSLNVTYTVSGTTTTKPVDLTSNGNWAMGTKYVYTLTIGLDEITVNPSVISWDTATEQSGPHNIL